jgi:pyruvate-formate lyase
MDVDFGDFLEKDLQNGTLTKDEALRLLQSLWQLMADRNTVVHGRIIIGGKGRRNVKNADEFALLALEASRTVLEVEPQLSLRIYDGMDERVYEKALNVIGEGRTYPILYNDEVNIPSVIKAFEFTPLEAEQYVPYGCGEYILEHKSFGTPSGVINLLKALEVTLHNGVDPLSGKLIGLQLGQFKDFKTFDDLWNAYKKQVEFFVDLMAKQEVIEYKIAGETAPFLFASILYDDCIEKGKGLFEGGTRYLGGTLETYGNTNTADSFTAIKRLVYEQKKISKEELLCALDNNFDGFTNLRKELLKQPKYGNDNNEADSMLVDVHEHVCNYVRDQKHKVDLHSYLVVIINNSANTLMGRSTSASADGRLAGTYMNNGNAPSGGNDKEGVTAMLNSISKPDTSIHAGAVQNMKFSKRMITVVSKNDLENAIKEPEKYQHLFVRVGGFSARFVELSPDVQKDILSRTLY